MKEDIIQRVNDLTDRANRQENKLDAVVKKLNENSDEVLVLRRYIRRQIKRDFQTLYKELYTLQQGDYYRAFFADDGLFYYFACLWGYMRRYMPEGEPIGRKTVDTLVGRYVMPIRNALILLRGQLDKHWQNEEGNMKMEMNLYEIETSTDFVELDNRLQYLRGQVDEKRRDANRLFYEHLWTLVEPLVGCLEGEGIDRFEQLGDEDLTAEVSRWVLQLRVALEAGGLSLAEPVPGDACTDDVECYVQSRSVAFATPMIRRKSDGCVFVKGIVPVTD